MAFIEYLFITPNHQYKGFYGGPPGNSPMVTMSTIDCVAGRGIEGDRYFDHEPDYKGQITFFRMEVYEALLGHLGITAEEKPPSQVRRNVLTRGVDLDALIGKEFTIQGVRFLGTEECRPCFWMDQAFRDGANDFLKGQGGLRAKILRDGTLQPGMFHV